MRQGPLAGRYPAVAAMVMFALIPYLALSAALNPLTPIISHQLHVSLQTLSLGGGLGNAAYATGTVLAVQFAQHLPQRRMLVGYAVLLVIGSLLEASAQNAGMFLAGHVIQGLCTSLLLIGAVPPLALGFPQDKLRDTAVIMNICIFGAVALGPLVGGIQAQAHAWRPLFWVVAGISVMALILAALTFEDSPAANPDSPRDLPAIGLAATGCVAAFFGASELTSHPFLSGETIAPLIGGLLLIVILLVYQCTAKSPLLTIKSMLTSSIPVAGIVVALFAAAASVSATALTVTVLAPHYSAAHIGLLYLPEVGGAIVSAVALGMVIRRRAIHYLPLFGMFTLAAGIAVFRISVPSSQALTLVGSGLTGIGLGATVAPALFVAGFSLPSANLQRVFAIVELFRAVAAFMIAPIFVRFAATATGNLATGTGAVRCRLLAPLREPAARVRNRRAHASGGRIHDRADLRPLRGDRRPGQSRFRHRHRAVDRSRNRGRWRASRRHDLRTERRAPAEARPRRLPAGTGSCLALAAAARPHPHDRCCPGGSACRYRDGDVPPERSRGPARASRRSRI